MRIWTEEAKAAQREAIKRWQPWTKSTGPRTSAGKERSSGNARKAECISIKSRRMLHTALRAQSQFRQVVHQYVSWQREKKSENRTIMMAQLRGLAATLHEAFLKRILEWQTLDQQEDACDSPLILCEMKMAA